ncbi:MAG: arginine--tRNA ligase [Spirochaetota bacterium]
MILTKWAVRDVIRDAIYKAVETGRISHEGELPDIKVEYPKEERFGDYATPFALECARILKRSPLDIGETLKPFIESHEMIERVEVVKPGFINIFLSIDFFVSRIYDAIANHDAYGTSDAEKKEKYNIEFVSANPTGPLNVVSARAAALGDSLGNILEAAGHDVDREFYVNDYGNQVNLFGKSVYYRYRELSGETVDFPDDGYQGDYVKDIARSILDTGAFRADMFPNEEEIIEFMSTYAIDYILNGQQKIMKEFRVNYDRWFRESELHAGDDVERVFTLLAEKGYLYDDDGKKVFRATDFGDDKDRVVVREDGRPTYLMADIAYHNNTLKRGYDTLIDIWGPDHHGYIARLAGAVEALGYERSRFKVLIAQQVNLILDGEPVKMSKRLGRFSTMKDLIDDIGVDASRYFFVMRSMDSHLDFDLDLARRASSENPVFYLQYAHARICSVFKEAEKRGIDTAADSLNSVHIDTPETVSLVKTLVRFPEEVQDAAQSLEVHRIATYLMRLAQQYHKFYTVNRILTDDADRTASLLALCRAVQITIHNGLRLLGVSAPETM